MTFVDQEIEHITRVMAPSLQGEDGVPILPVDYWRDRLHNLLAHHHLTHGQFCAVDTMLRQLDGFEAVARWSTPMSDRACRPAGAGQERKTRKPSRPRLWRLEEVRTLDGRVTLASAALDVAR